MKILAGCGFLLLAGIVLIVLANVLSPNKPAAGPAETTVTLTAPLVCSKGLLGLDTLARVRATGDVPGIAGLVARDKAILVLAGSVVHVVTHNAEWSSVYVRSGAMAGESCWIQPGWVK